MLSLLQKILKNLAKKILNRYQPKIVGVTGSIGKSSSKEAIAAVLSLKYRVRASYKNYNNEIGLPLTVIGVKKIPGKSLISWLGILLKALGLLFGQKKYYPEILILEMGADKPGDIKYLTEIAQPDVAVLTSIAHSHIESFKTIEEVAKEKKYILKNLSPDGLAVLNFDNELVMKDVKTEAKILSYGLKDGADMQAINVGWIFDEQTAWPTGLNFKINFEGNIVPMALSNVVAEHLIPAVLSGLAVGVHFDVNLVEAAAALRKFNSLPGRMRLIPGIKKTLLVDDSYNANPESTNSALETVSEIAVSEEGERIAVLGDMLELGSAMEKAHTDIGKKVADLGYDLLITVGEASKRYTAHAARSNGMQERDVASFDNSAEAGRFLQDILDPGDVVLIKGSQGTRMEKVVKEVMAEPLRAKELLARQDGGWK